MHKNTCTYLCTLSLTNKMAAMVSQKTAANLVIADASLDDATIVVDEQRNNKRKAAVGTPQISKQL